VRRYSRVNLVCHAFQFRPRILSCFFLFLFRQRTLTHSASFRKLLPPTYAFEFIDGPYPDTAAAGIDLFYPPPYYKLYSSVAIPSIKAGHAWLLSHIEEHGPYDGVMSFSQGCALTSSFLLYHQAHYPDRPPPFKVAIFICGGVPLTVVEDLGVDVSEEAREWEESSKLILQAKASSEAILRYGTNRWGEGFDPFVHDKRDKENVFGFDFSRVPTELLIQIPTVHVYGNRDPRFPASVTLAHFCEKSVRRTFDHGGGHDIPKRRDVRETMKELVEWCGMMADRH